MKHVKSHQLGAPTPPLPLSGALSKSTIVQEVSCSLRQSLAGGGVPFFPIVCARREAEVPTNDNQKFEFRPRK
ncbi:unnamed protein product, partial [Iphiclides podalirius]